MNVKYASAPAMDSGKTPALAPEPANAGPSGMADAGGVTGRIDRPHPGQKAADCGIGAEQCGQRCHDSWMSIAGNLREHE